MKKLLLLICLVLIMTGCTAENDLTVDTNPENSENVVQPAEEASVLPIDEGLSEIEKARKDVIEKFKNERDVLGTGKFIEETYKLYPNDEVISTIYNYNTAIFYIEAYINLGNEEWLDKAKSHASKISLDYNKEFSGEIIPFVTELLGEEWQKIKNETAEKEERFSKLTLEDKKEIYKFIKSRYKYYDKKDGGNTGDKYSDIIWKEASEKYNLAEHYITEIWLDTDVYTAFAQDNEPGSDENGVEVYDAVLDFDNGNALIAIDEETLDRFMDALVRGEVGTINELYENHKVAEVPKGTKVNIIERKLTRAKVRILDDIYKGNEVWVLIESIKD
jgi:hypothetical protein